MNTTGRSWPKGRTSRSLARLATATYAGRRKIATATATLLAVALGYHVIFGQNGLIVYKQKRDETHMLDTQLDLLRRENERLRDHGERLQNDPNAIEHQAREELHYTRPGEVIYTLPVRTHAAAVPAAPSSPGR